MRKNVGDCDLYKQSEDIIKKYEDLAFLKLWEKGIIDCCNGGYPRKGKHKLLFEQTACNMYEADKRKKKRKSDKSK